MRATFDRNLCGAWAPACEECFGTFLARDLFPDRLCVTSIVEDGSPNLNALIHSGTYVGTLTVTPENREAIIHDGWRRHCTLPDEAFDIKPPTGEYCRTGGWRG